MGEKTRALKRLENLDLEKQTYAGRYDVDWIQLVQNRVQRRAFVNTVKNLRVPYKGGAGGFLEQL
jgi:hypothetical protein